MALLPKPSLRSVCLAAKDAFKHLQKIHKNIIQVLKPPRPILIQAGFNEDFVREGRLLQEIHISSLTSFKPKAHVLEEVWRLCAPFPCMISMPSGLTFRSPLCWDVIRSSGLSAYKIGYDDVMTTGMGLVLSNCMAGNISIKQYSLQGGDDNNRDNGGQVAPEEFSTVQQKSGLDALPPDSGHAPGDMAPPGYEDGTQNRHLHSVHFDITSGDNEQFIPELQLIGDFTFQKVPGQKSMVHFTKLKCQTRDNTNVAQRYLKVKINTGEIRWRLEDVGPKTTLASDERYGQGKRTKTTNNGTRQLATKLALKFISWCGLDLEGSCVVNKSFEPISRIIQKDSFGVMWWVFHIDDEHAEEVGVELKQSTLPFVNVAWLGAPDALPQPEKFEVEIASLWTLTAHSKGLPSPVYSNICQMAVMDLSASVAHRSIAEGTEGEEKSLSC